MSVPGPSLGPCTSWITGEDVLGCCGLADVDASALDVVAAEASMALYEISGRIFTGLCDRTVRPCRDGCGCWGSSSAPLWAWDGSAPAWGWFDERGGRCGCERLEQVKLSGYPVREITEVTIDGVVVDPSTYRLDEWRFLTRLDDPGPPVAKRYWPGCQNLALNDGPGTFIVSYRCGVDPPQIGRDAAAEVACQLYRACNPGQKCALPAGVTRVQRQGIEIERGLLANWLDPKKPTGLVHVDLFLKAYAGRGRRRAAIYSPDLQEYARPL